MLISCLRGDLPPATLDVLLHGRHWGLSRWRLVQFPPLRDRAASDQGPGHLAVLTGPPLHGGPNEQDGPTQHVPQPLLHMVRRLRAGLALYGWWCGDADGAGPRRCTAGVTPAYTRTRDRWTDARTGPGPLCPRNGKRPHSELAPTKTR